MKEYIIDIKLNDQGLIYTTISIPWPNGVKFRFLNCYIEYELPDGDPYDSNLIIRYLCNENDYEIAEENLIQAMCILGYILHIPLHGSVNYGLDYEADNLPKWVTECIDIPEFIEIENNILKFNKVKESFNMVTKLYNQGLMYYFSDSLKEEAFLCFFKILERISSQYIAQNKKIFTVCLDISSYENDLKKQLLTNYNLIYSNKKMQNLMYTLCKQMSTLIQASIENNVGQKVCILLKEHDVNSVSSEEIDDMVSLRNKIVHGEYVDMKYYLGLYEKIRELALIIISKYYFKKQYEDIAVKTYMIPPY